MNEACGNPSYRNQTILELPTEIHSLIFQCDPLPKILPPNEPKDSWVRYNTKIIRNKQKKLLEKAHQIATDWVKYIVLSMLDRQHFKQLDPIKKNHEAEIVKLIDNLLKYPKGRQCIHECV